MTCNSTRQGSVVESPGWAPIGAFRLAPGLPRRVGALAKPYDGIHSRLHLRDQPCCRIHSCGNTAGRGLARPVSRGRMRGPRSARRGAADIPMHLYRVSAGLRRARI